MFVNLKNCPISQEFGGKSKLLLISQTGDQRGAVCKISIKKKKNNNYIKHLVAIAASTSAAMVIDLSPSQRRISAPT